MAKAKETKRRTQVKDLKKSEEELTPAQSKKVKGGLLPYVEQENVYKSTSIKDGTSNTLLGGK
jgi:hypothetical protein